MSNDNQGINPLPENQGIAPTYNPKPQANTLKEYNEYVALVEARNLEIDMYDGDTYMPNQEIMSYKEWSEE